MRAIDLADSRLSILRRLLAKAETVAVEKPAAAETKVARFIRRLDEDRARQERQA